VRLLFVCLGNICRSPTAEGTMRRLVREAGLEQQIELDSAGTGSWHVGTPPDARATAAAAARGIELEGAARRVRVEDFDEFDLILAMDRSNLAELQRLAPSDSARARIRLLREFDPASAAGQARAGGEHDREGQEHDGDLDASERDGEDHVRDASELDVPDPYYGDGDGFERVLDHVQAACAGLLAQIRAGELR
jgi:protein-tyrosine phosphatase